ncbi:MAG TPA: OsmC family peroxiredoxin [Longimicrobium sp.]|nr:OsmC family peroxiredoxin [Longimicrobium sp.]
MATRRASAVWNGGLPQGSGSFKGESGVIEAPYSFGSRFADEGGTNPEELLAAAEAACFSMAFSGNLQRNGTPSESVQTSAACTVEKVENGFKITRMQLTVRARVPGIDNDKFQEIARTTKETCPVSVALGNVPMEIEATLESA